MEHIDWFAALILGLVALWGVGSVVALLVWGIVKVVRCLGQRLV